MGHPALRLTLALLAAAVLSLADAKFDYQWRTGRASYYGTDACVRGGSGARGSLRSPVGPLAAVPPPPCASARLNELLSCLPHPLAHSALQVVHPQGQLRLRLYQRGPASGEFQGEAEADHRLSHSASVSRGQVAAKPSRRPLTSPALPWPAHGCITTTSQRWGPGGA